MSRNARFVTRAAVIAAMYFALTLVIWQFGSGAIQLRASEAMCVLPLLFPEAVPGLFIGCLIANLIAGAHPLDVIFGSLATLAAAWLTMKAGYKRPEIASPKYWLALCFPVLLNMFMTGTIIWICYGFTGFGLTDNHMWQYLPVTWLTVGAGEAVCVMGLGTLFYLALRRMPKEILA